MLLVTYDLKKPGRDYADLYEVLKSASSWAKPAESVWLLKTNISCSDWIEKIKKVVDSNDVVFVIKVTQTWASYNVSKKVVEWIKNPSNWS